MNKLFALPFLLMFGATAQATSYSFHGQISNDKSYSSIGYYQEVAIFGDIFGEGALKKDCLELWGGYSQYPDLVRKRCAKASKEIDFAKAEYPVILESVKSLKYGINRDNDPLSTYKRLQVLKQKCDNKIAVRAAKTVRYWGTTEVGSSPDVKNKTITSLSGLKVSEYGEILDACKQNSWLESRLASIRDRLVVRIQELSSGSSSTESICKPEAAQQISKMIDNQYINNIKEKTDEYKSMLNSLDGLESVILSKVNTNDSGSSDTSISPSAIYDARQVLNGRIKSCEESSAVASKYLLENQKNQREQERLERQRAAEIRRQKNFANAIESVDLE